MDALKSLLDGDPEEFTRISGTVMNI